MLAGGAQLFRPVLCGRIEVMLATLYNSLIDSYIRLAGSTMPSNKSRYARRHMPQNRCKAKKGEVCCQATTRDGTKCKRIASVVFDLSKRRQFRIGSLGFEHPGFKCCAFCWQHATILIAGYGLRAWEFLTATLGPKLAGFTPEETLFVSYPRWSYEKRKMYGVEGLPF